MCIGLEIRACGCAGQYARKAHRSKPNITTRWQCRIIHVDCISLVQTAEFSTRPDSRIWPNSCFCSTSYMTLLNYSRRVHFRQSAPVLLSLPSRCLLARISWSLVSFEDLRS